MHRPLLPLLVAGTLLLAAVALPVAAASEKEERERGRGGGSAEQASDGSGDSTEGAAEDRGRGRGRSTDGPLTEDEIEQLRPGPSVGMFRMEHNSRVVHGRHVSFLFNDTGVQDFSAAGVNLFDLTVTPGEDDRSGRRPEVGGHGAALILRSPSFTFKAHDNPGAVAKLESDGAASRAFGPDARLVEASEGRVDFVVGNVSGSVRAREVNLTGQTVTVEGEALVFLSQSRGLFDKHRDDVSLAIGKGHVGAEATIGKREGIEELVEEVVSYGNVTMTTLKAERGNLTLAVEGHGTEGRVLVLNVDGRVVGAQKREDLTILMDNMSIPAATDLADVLDPENDGYMPEYYVVFDPATESFQLLVSVPHYSVHILSVTTPIPLPPPSVVLGIVAGVALLVPGAYVLFRRKE